MKKNYLLAICLAAALRVQAQTSSSDFGRPQIIDEPQVDRPTSVHAADLNGDGSQDILTASSDDNQIAWYPSVPSENSEPRVITTQADQAQDVYTADLDGDGDSDVLSASSGDNPVAWYANDGQGNFGEPQLISNQADGASAVHSADLDGDGDSDVLSASSEDGTIAWYANDGQGNFSGQRLIATQANQAQDVYTADLDGDGDPDVLSASSQKIAWYANDGQGNFGEAQTISTRSASEIYTADLDGDGDQDVLLGRTNLDIIWYANDGQGRFEEQEIFFDIQRGGLGGRAYAADMDDDGDQDILSSYFYSFPEYGISFNTFRWYANDGQGNFSFSGSTSERGNEISEIYTADVDGDGDQDAITISSVDNKLTWYTNDEQNVFSASVAVTDQGSTQDLTAADLDEDGDQDVLAASSFAAEDGRVVYYANSGSAAFDEQLAVAEQNSRPQFIFAPDLDEDGDQDVLLATDFNIVWYANEGQEAFGESIEIGRSPADHTIQVAQVADLDGDGDLDVLATYQSFVVYSSLTVWYENRQGVFEPPQTITDAIFVNDLSVADLDGDGNQDVLTVTSFRGSQPVWYKNDGQNNFSRQPGLEGTDISSADPVDLDNDGDLDVLSYARGSNRLVWYANDGQGRFGEQQLIAEPTEQLSDLLPVDLNQDGAQDVLLYGQEGIVWYANEGSGRFRKEGVITDQLTQVVTAADLNGDDALDIVAASFNDKIVWYENLLNTPPAADRIGIALINADTDQVVQPLQDGDTIDIAATNLTSFSALASSEMMLDSVRFTLEGAISQTRTERFVPYALFADGDQGSDFFGEEARVGNYTLGVEAFRPNGPAIRQTVRFRLQRPAIESLTLVRTFEGTVVDTLSDGVAIDLARFGSSGFSVQAVPNQAVERIIFQLQGPIARRQVERRAPYTLFGDQGTTFLGVPPSPGSYTLYVTPLVRRVDDGTLAVGKRTRINFQLVGSPSTADLRVYPNRFDQEFFIETPQPVDQVRVRLQSVHGRPQAVRIQREAQRWRVTTPGVPSGHYVLQLISPQGTQARRVVKK